MPLEQSHIYYCCYQHQNAEWICKGVICQCHYLAQRNKPEMAVALFFSFRVSHNGIKAELNKIQAASKMKLYLLQTPSRPNSTRVQSTRNRISNVLPDQMTQSYYDMIIIWYCHFHFTLLAIMHHTIMYLHTES